jgi:hypothetical protein
VSELWRCFSDFSFNSNFHVVVTAIVTAAAAVVAAISSSFVALHAGTIRAGLWWCLACDVQCVCEHD